MALSNQDEERIRAIVREEIDARESTTEAASFSDEDIGEMADTVTAKVMRRLQEKNKPEDQ